MRILVNENFPGNAVTAFREHRYNADFSNWDAFTGPHFLAIARTLTQAAHESLVRLPDTQPLVVDPFVVGGAIPLEALVGRG